MRLASYLETVASQFEQLDRGEAAAIGRVTGPVRFPPDLNPYVIDGDCDWGLPGSLLGGFVPDMQFSAAPVVAGGMAGVVGLGALTGAFGGLKDWWQDFKGRIPFLGKTHDDGQAAIPVDPANHEPECTDESEMGGFGKIMAEEERREQEEAQREAEAAAQKRARILHKGTDLIGKRVDYDGLYGTQCVDLVRELRPDIGSASGSIAAGYLQKAIRTGESGQPVPGPGDVLVWGVNVGAAQGAGHVAVVEAIGADGRSVTVIEQNAPIGAATRRHTYELIPGMGFIPLEERI